MKLTDALKKLDEAASIAAKAKETLEEVTKAEHEAAIRYGKARVDADSAHRKAISEVRAAEKIVADLINGSIGAEPLPEGVKVSE